MVERIDDQGAIGVVSFLQSLNGLVDLVVARGNSLRTKIESVYFQHAFTLFCLNEDG